MYWINELVQENNVKLLLVICSTLSAILTWYVRYGIEKIPWFFRQYNTLKYCLDRRKIVYLWCDDFETRKTWRDSLHTYDIDIKRTGKHIRIVTLNAPRDILRWPLSRRRTAAVVFLATNTVRFAYTDKEREATEMHILKYVRKGGIFFSSHDTLYRRVNNKTLIDTMGYHTDTFHKTYTDMAHKTDEVLVTYVMTETGRAFFRHVCSYAIANGITNGIYTGADDRTIFDEGRFRLMDSEIAYSPNRLQNGFPGDDITVLCWSERGEILADRELTVPLFMVKRHHHGLIFWINSGDRHHLSQCGSLSEFNPVLKAIVTFLIYNSNQIYNWVRNLPENQRPEGRNDRAQDPEEIANAM